MSEQTLPLAITLRITGAILGPFQDELRTRDLWFEREHTSLADRQIRWQIPGARLHILAQADTHVNLAEKLYVAISTARHRTGAGGASRDTLHDPTMGAIRGYLADGREVDITKLSQDDLSALLPDLLASYPDRRPAST